MNCTDATCPTQTACFCVLHNRLIIECVWDQREKLKKALEVVNNEFESAVMFQQTPEGSTTRAAARSILRVNQALGVALDVARVEQSTKEKP